MEELEKRVVELEAKLKKLEVLRLDERIEPPGEFRALEDERLITFTELAEKVEEEVDTYREESLRQDMENQWENIYINGRTYTYT